MGLITAPFVLSNPRDATLLPIHVDALVDTGAMTLCLPAAVAEALQLEELERREVTLADGGRHLVPYVGPVKIGFGKRGCFTGAFVLGHRVFVGAIPLEDMDLVINPATRRVTVNPASPEIPSAIVMLAGASLQPGSFERSATPLKSARSSASSDRRFVRSVESGSLTITPSKKASTSPRRPASALRAPA